MITLDKALEIASASAAPEIEKTRGEGLEVRPVKFVRDGNRYWTFAAAIPKLQDEGMAPGAIMVSVDKEDGHVWTAEDFNANTRK